MTTTPEQAALDQLARALDDCAGTGCREHEDDAPPAWFRAMQWTPKVGDRVRCVPSPECRKPWEDVIEGEIGHWPDEMGVTGTVEDIWPSSRDEHPYMVRWDTRLFARGDWWRAGFYDAVELEPLSPAPDDDGADGRQVPLLEEVAG